MRSFLSYIMKKQAGNLVDGRYGKSYNIIHEVFVFGIDTLSRNPRRNQRWYITSIVEKLSNVFAALVYELNNIVLHLFMGLLRCIVESRLRVRR